MLQDIAIIIALIAAWIAAGAMGAWLFHAIEKMSGHRVDGLETFAGRTYFAMLAIFGPAAILMAIGTAIGQVTMGRAFRG
jgi:xanthine/uracil permease